MTEKSTYKLPRIETACAVTQFLGLINTELPKFDIALVNYSAANYYYLSLPRVNVSSVPPAIIESRSTATRVTSSIFVHYPPPPETDPVSPPLNPDGAKILYITRIINSPLITEFFTHIQPNDRASIVALFSDGDIPKTKYPRLDKVNTVIRLPESTHPPQIDLAHVPLPRNGLERILLLFLRLLERESIRDSNNLKPSDLPPIAPFPNPNPWASGPGQRWR